MYPQLTAIIWFLFKLMLAFSVSFSIMIILLAIFGEKTDAARRRNLLEVKNSVRILSGRRRDGLEERAETLSRTITPGRFLELARGGDTAVEAEFLGRIKKSMVLSRKIKTMERIARFSRNKWRKIRAQLIIGYSDSPEAFGILNKALLNSDDDISYYAMLGLAQLKTSQAARTLLDFIPRRRFSGYKIASCVEKFPGPIIDDLLKASERDDPLLRYWSVRLMTKFKDPRSLEKAIELTGDASPDVRAASCECLGSLRDPKGVDSLGKRLSDPVWYVRMHAIRSLYKISGPAAVPLVIPLLKDGNWLVRDAVKCVLISEPVKARPHFERIFMEEPSCRSDCMQVLAEWRLTFVYNENYL